LLDDALRALEPTFRLDNLVAMSADRGIVSRLDRVLKRPVSIRVHLAAEAPGRAWFMRETETLAQLDHPAIRHVYAAGEIASFAYRTANWIEGESLADALRRGPRPIPQSMSLIRDLLAALEHAHARAIIMRRIVPSTLMINSGGQGVITDLRYSNWCLPYLPPLPRMTRVRPHGAEVRAGEAGEPAMTCTAWRRTSTPRSRRSSRPRSVAHRAAREQRQAFRCGRARHRTRAVTRAQGSLLHGDRDARGLRDGCRHVSGARLRAGHHRDGFERRLRARWATTTSCSRRSAPAGSAGCIAPATWPRARRGDQGPASRAHATLA